MTKGSENQEAGLEEHRWAVETWEHEGGAQLGEHGSRGLEITTRPEPEVRSSEESRPNPEEVLEHAKARVHGEVTSSEQRLRDQSTFARLARRYAQLGHAFSAEAQRERASLQAPLIEVYARLHPTSRYNQMDDLDVIMRAHNRSPGESVRKESRMPA